MCIRDRQRGDRVLAIHECLAATWHAVQVRAQVAHLVTVLGDTTPQERVDLVEPGRYDVGELLRVGELKLGPGRLKGREAAEGCLQGLTHRSVIAGVGPGVLIGDDLDRAHGRGTPWQVRPPERQDRLHHHRLGRAQRGVDGAVEDLWTSPAQVNGHLAVSYTHLRAHETVLDLVCRLLLEKK